MPLPGDELLALCSGAQSEVILVAPFMKAAVIKRIFDVIPQPQIRIKCVTRWKPEEIVAGVSDIEVFDIVAETPSATLLLHPLLHAKYFRVDNTCIIGSANLTHRALGWASPSNLELTLQTESKQPSLKEFERKLFRDAVPATKRFRDDITVTIEQLRLRGVELAAGSRVLEVDKSGIWLPLCIRPESLYQIYSNQGTESMVNRTLMAGRDDLKALDIQPGLSEEFFRSYITAAMAQSILFQMIYDAAKVPISNTTGIGLIQTYINNQPLKYSIDQHWEIVKEWLLFFMPNVYRVPYGSDDILRSTEIGTL